MHSVSEKALRLVFTNVCVVFRYFSSIISLPRNAPLPLHVYDAIFTRIMDESCCQTGLNYYCTRTNTPQFVKQ